VKNNSTASRILQNHPYVYEDYYGFIHVSTEENHRGLTAVSLFSGGGIGDYGYWRSGFYFHTFAETDQRRCKIIKNNFHNTNIIEGDLRENWREVIESYQEHTSERLSLLAASPPCQSLTTATQKKEKHPWKSEIHDDYRNHLYQIVPIVAQNLQPKVVVVENVPEILVTHIKNDDDASTNTIAEALGKSMTSYHLYAALLQMADFGVPQLRERVFFIFVHRDEEWNNELISTGRLPIPRQTHGVLGGSPWITLQEALTVGRYNKLDSIHPETSRDPTDSLHIVPTYDDVRYQWIAQNPKNKGQSSFRNSHCNNCSHENVPLLDIYCEQCGTLLTGIPYIDPKNGPVRRIKGRKTAYRRMRPNQPAATITTASGRFSSDNTIHPSENRVLSLRECSDIQTVPRKFDYIINGDLTVTLVRSIIGEAIPPWFTYQLGRIIFDLLNGVHPNDLDLMDRDNPASIPIYDPIISPISHSTTKRINANLIR
jgi:DNA (cytosine-5)-methyltransferase 1